MNNETKNFHFMELGWVVSFPICGNRGKYLNYSVTLMNMKEGTPQNGKLLKLEEVVENHDFENSYPHTVGFYKNSFESSESKPEYLEIRKINNVEEFWLFLNALDI